MYAFAYILEGTTIEIYCSEQVRFVAKQDAIVEAISPFADVANFKI
ncbi:hypothetical protein protein [Bacillus cereus G9241]|nr:hypothetical protein protein [Bacillus cereus G9241]